MSTTQLLIKNADQKSFRNWVMAINDPVTENQSGEFYFFGPRLEVGSDSTCLLVGSLLDDEQFNEDINPYLHDFCEYETIQIVIGQYMYSKNKEKVDRLARCLQLMKYCSDSAEAIVLYEEWEDEETKWRKVEITTV